MTSAEDSQWSLVLASEHVFAYPDRVGQGEGVEVVPVPIVVRRRDTGSLVQRLVFPGDGKLATAAAPRSAGGPLGAITFHLDHFGAVVATPRGVWGLGVQETAGPATPVRGVAR